MPETKVITKVHIQELLCI